MFAPSSMEQVREVVVGMRLPYLRVSLTPDCNARCSFCHNEGQKIGGRGTNAVPRKTRLPLFAYEDMATRFRGLLSRVKLTGGEPTMVSNLPDIVNIFRSRGYDVSMTTNGWYLDETRQLELKAAGLNRINVSFPSIVPAQYDRVFVEPGWLPKVMANLRLAKRIFPGCVKLNFMALRDITFPNDVAGLCDFAGEISATVSMLSLVSSRDSKSVESEDLLRLLSAQYSQLKIEEELDDFVPKLIVTLPGGCRWEIDDFRRANYRAHAFDNEFCRRCAVNERCVEGPYALRVSAEGVFRPCLIRTDNVFTLASSDRA